MLLTADWLAPMDGPVIRDGGLLISEGVIRRVGAAATLRRDHPPCQAQDLGPAVLLPGLVNAHVHLELSALSPGDPPTSFVEWLKRLVKPTPPPPEVLAAMATRGVEIGVAQCLRFGVTSVGDISRQCQVTRPLLAGGPLRVVSYGEVQAMAGRRGLLEPRVAVAADASHQSTFLQTAIAPHAPYSVEADGYRRCLDVARSRGLPLATHLAETPDEAAFLAAHAGPFRALWEYLGGWDDDVPTFVGGPIRFAQAMGLLEYPALLAHVNYCDDAELALLARGRASVAYCPRTHAYFGHPPHRWRDMLHAGVNVALGTDSCASAPDLNLVDDLRLLHRIAPDVPPLNLWEMATIRAARAIGQERAVGTLSVGKPADVVAFPAFGNDPLRAILERDVRTEGVWINGLRDQSSGLLKG